MADFKIFEPILLKQEGGYANKKNDSGGETWMGIARNYYPKWSGWTILDANKNHLPSNDYAGWKAFSIYLRTLPNLQILVDSFYKKTFWDQMQGDLIANQSIANFIGDWGVNAGLGVPIKHAQKILGLLQDGGLGPKTLAAINSVDGLSFFTKMKQERIQFYYDVIKAHPEDKQFLSGWLERTNYFKYQS